jgi:Carboxypeptidase regulatory-like domain
MGQVRRYLLVALACLTLPWFAMGQATTGSVSGVVTGPDGKPLPGATVTISGPLLPRGQATTTLSDGAFRFAALPPGTYHVKAELPGLGKFEQDVVVSIGKDTQVRPSIKATAQEVVTVSAATPLVDVKATDVSKVTTTESIQKLPLDRTYTGLFQLAPGVADTGNISSSPDAGGNRQDNAYLYDGVNVTNPFFGDLYQNFAELDIQEVNVTRGGLPPDQGRTGGMVVNGVTKSGTNNFQGELRLEYQPSSFQAKDRNPGLTSSTRRFRPGADIGGPIFKDVAWFYGSANFYRQTDLDRSNDFGSIPDQNTNIDEYFGKLTAAPTTSQLIDASFRYRGTEQKNADLTASTAPSVADQPKEIDRVGVLSWFWTVNPNVSIEAKYNHNESNWTRQGIPVTPLGYKPMPFNFAEPYLMGSFTTGTGAGTSFIFPPATALGQTIGGNQYAQNNQSFFRDEGRIEASYFGSFLGATHNIKAGVDYNANLEDVTRVENGWGAITVTTSSNCGSIKPCYRARGYPLQPTQKSRATTWGLFLQDQATWNRLTINAGVLVNRDQYIPDNDSEFLFLSGPVDTPTLSNTTLAGMPCSSNPAPCTYRDRLTFNFAKQWQPRVGASYEIDPSVHDKAYANFARYDNLDNQSIARAAAPVRVYREDNYIDPNTGNIIRTVVQANQTNKLVLPNIKPTYTDEYVVGYARPLPGGWSAEAWGMYRKTQDVIEDFASKGNNFTDLNPTNFRYGNIPGKRYYRAATIEVRKAYGSNWTMDLSYTLSRLTGNWDLDYATELFYASSYIGDGPGLNPTDPNRSGVLLGDHTHVAKLFGSYTFPTNTTVGGYLRFQSGGAWEARGFDPVYGTDYLYLEPAGSRRMPSWTNFDFLVAQTIPISGNLGVRLEARVLNVFNTQTVLAVYHDYYLNSANTILNTAANGSAHPFGTGAAFAPPRRFVLTGTLTF